MNLDEGIYIFTEDMFKKEVRLLNDGSLAKVAYLNNRPAFLQKDENYSWDKIGEDKLKDYVAFDTNPFFNVSLKPSEAFKK